MHNKTTLPNGLRIVTGELPHTRSATVSMYVGAGSRYEPDEEAGLSHFLEHMLFKGASRRPTAREISEAIESVGGSHNAATDRELTVYYAKVPHTAAMETIDILADMIRAPIMDPAELEKERSVILEELASVEDSPGELAGILIDETLWPGQPIGRNVGGSPDSVSSLPISAVNAYLARQYVPENTVLAVAGNVNHEEVVAAAERWLGAVPKQAPGAWYPATARNGTVRFALRQKETEQAHICLAYPSVSLSDPDRYAVDLLSTVLGEGMSSRLFLELREERALVYDIHSYPSEFRDTGSFTIYAGCDPSNARVTVEAVLEETYGLLKGLPAAELRKAKEMAKGRIQLRMEDTRSVAGWIGSQELLLGRVQTVDEVVEQIEAVEYDQLMAVAKRILSPDQATMAIVGPFSDETEFTRALGV
ncbi:MAG: insulinase family protein [Dehalococcoidia bacterium]|jgi:predicted Zn-dependent peptidase|uniref:M16 family metallopeptidase n=1 Tax=Candidatus Amarobacter glycogenicus TaxID=3140699 RepID=UPI001E157FEE|nr:insulinase family protein [Dehalococcoidia bacterium]MBK6563257.1 insulinase family protein [Dehalococcoidia bacterium]MBK7126188.1 insulinase family protein [Dehalococcoidia bacterium]MBK7329841.1 insulinase family protein [Dehalococcoidia bacterium]MBK7725649.1 insulinase family protein [Dehalococcoidia bacterium]